MKAYRIYTVYTEYRPSEYYDEDGYCDDYYDELIEHELTEIYVKTLKDYHNFVKQRKAVNDYNEYYYEEINILTIDN